MLEKAFLVASDGELQPTICLSTLDKRCSINICFCCRFILPVLSLTWSSLWARLVQALPSPSQSHRQHVGALWASAN